MFQKAAALAIVVAGAVVGAGAAAGVFGPKDAQETSVPRQSPPPENIQGRSAAPAAEARPQASLTDKLIASVGESIARENAGVAGGKDKIKMPDKESLEKAFMSAVTEELPWERITKDKLHIAALATEATEMRYLNEVDAVTHRNFDGFGKTVFDALQAFTDAGDVALFSELAVRAERQAAELAGVEVPASLADTHLDLVNLWRRKLAAYRAIVNGDRDPLGASIAIRAVQEIATEDARIQSVLIARYKELANRTP